MFAYNPHYCCFLFYINTITSIYTKCKKKESNKNNDLTDFFIFYFSLKTMTYKVDDTV